MLARQSPGDVPAVGSSGIGPSHAAPRLAVLTIRLPLELTGELDAVLTIVLTNARTRVVSGGLWRHSARSQMVGPVGLEPTT